MLKVIILLKRRPGSSHEEFMKHWKEKHGPLVTKLVPGLRKYVQNHLINLPGMEYDTDGIAELWFDDIDAFQNFVKWRDTDGAKEMIKDELSYVDNTSSVRFIVEEHQMK